MLVIFRMSTINSKCYFRFLLKHTKLSLFHIGETKKLNGVRHRPLLNTSKYEWTLNLKQEGIFILYSNHDQLCNLKKLKMSF
jgi:hypothetical protein